MDLTEFGLGVDSYFLSRKFNRFVHNRPDPRPFGSSSLQFLRVNAANVIFTCFTAEEYPGKTPDFDWVYLDPSQREPFSSELVLRKTAFLTCRLSPLPYPGTRRKPLWCGTRLCWILNWPSPGCRPSMKYGSGRKNEAERAGIVLGNGYCLKSVAWPPHSRFMLPMKEKCAVPGTASRAGTCMNPMPAS